MESVTHYHVYAYHKSGGYEAKRFEGDAVTASAQGERVSLVNSEEIPAGSECIIEVTCLDYNHMAAVLEWLDYGKLRGIGQWRNSGKGRFTYQILS